MDPLEVSPTKAPVSQLVSQPLLVIDSNIPDHAASKPVTPMSVKIMARATVAMPTPIRKSLSVFEAKVRIQNPDIKKSLVKMATGKM